MRLRVGILVAVAISSTIWMTPSALSQPSQQEHERQPPPSADPAIPLGLPAGMPEAPPSEPMRETARSGEMTQGLSPSRSMSQMMNGPASTELYPTMIRISEPNPVERGRLIQRAEQWRSEGISLLSEGGTALSESTRQDDVSAMEQAGATISQGLSRLKSGLAARRSLESGEPPPQVALGWFKTQLNLLPAQIDPNEARIFGMTPFQLFLCTFMIAAIAVSLYVYVLRMRKASLLVERIVAGSTVEEEFPATAVAQRASAATTPSSMPIETPEGLLPILRKKLCRLRVARIYPETPDVKTFRFVSCDRGPIPFSYLPGQFLTLMLPIEGNPTKRSYTISSSPAQGYYCEISVKREDQGLGSRYLHDVVKEGDTFEARGPSGKLTFTGKESDSIVLIGGGVGITPVMSVTRALADMGWRGEIYFIIACSDPEHFIFGAEIQRLQERNPNLHVFVAMSALNEDLTGFHRGRITKDLLLHWVPNIATRHRIHLCASPDFMDAMKQMLTDLGVPSECIKTESFGSQEKPSARAIVRASQPKATTGQLAATLAFQRSEMSTMSEGDETVLEAGERIGIEMNYSCRVGSCGECSVRLISGEVKMDVEDALEPEDKAAGIILCCQARPISNIVVEA